MATESGTKVTPHSAIVIVLDIHKRLEMLTTDPSVNQLGY